MRANQALVALSLSLLGCEAAQEAYDAAIQTAQPGCPQGTFCAVSDAGTVLDAAPPLGTNPLTTPDARVPAAADAAVPALDATVAIATDASTVSLSDAAALDASAVVADAQSDAAPISGDASSPYPPVSDVSVKGPYTSKTVSNTGPGGAYTIFHPTELAPNGVLNPIIAWGNGGATTPVDYPQLPHFASHGFVVIASNDPLVNGQQVRAGTDWIVQQNELSTSPFYKKLDVKRVAGVGYSNGGLAQLETADDPRYLTVVIISGANLDEDSRTTNMPKLHTPIAYLCTADDASSGNCAADFAVVKQPAFYGVMKGTGHVDVTTFLGVGVDAVIKRVATATTAWLRWQVMNDQSYKSTFVGADCKLCTDSNWTAQQKNLQ